MQLTPSLHPFYIDYSSTEIEMALSSGMESHGLTEETAVYFHNECIKDLIRLSTGPEQVRSQLAAAIILRTYEEMSAPLRENGCDPEVFLNMLGLFFDAQVTQSGFGHKLTPSNTSDFLPGKRFNPLSLSKTEIPESYCPDTLNQVLSLVAARNYISDTCGSLRP